MKLIAHFFKFTLLALVFIACGAPTNEGYLIGSVEELHKQLGLAQPGDTLWLADGEWKDAEMVIEAKGTDENPIVVAVKNPGKLTFTGSSNLKLGGEHLVLSGFYFTNGFTLTKEVISFRINKTTLANNCRITQTVIANYSNPERHDNDLWVGVYGKNNRFDHNALIGKGNLGVTMAVRLNSEESRENNHQIDHNYFGPREVLGANGGETLRIGTSHYSLSDSKTQVINNYFDRCNGEHEIISNKSGANVFKGNTFYECAGTLTFRHGHGNFAESNAFFGNHVANTGGIRVINERQTVVNNYCYGLTGHRFRGAIVVMNGVPNSPINRYHQVRDSKISNNTLIDCDYVQLCAGSDAERSATPLGTSLTNNIIWNTKKDDVFTVYDDISGISFANNILSSNITKFKEEGFESKEGELEQNAEGIYSVKGDMNGAGINEDFSFVKKGETGPSWFAKPEKGASFGFGKVTKVAEGADLFEVVKKSQAGDVLELGKGSYLLTKVIKVHHPLSIKSTEGARIVFEKSNLFAIENGGALQLDGITIDGAESPDYAGNAVVSTSRYSMNKNYKLYIQNCSFENLDVNHSFSILKAYKNTFADSVLIENSRFTDVSGTILELDKETDDIGIYNAEFVTIKNSSFKNIGAQIAAMHRGGSDESTFGPLLFIDHCNFEKVGHQVKNKSGNGMTLLGVQKAIIQNSVFKDVKTIDIFHTVGEPITQISNCITDVAKQFAISDNTAQISNLKVGSESLKGTDGKQVGLLQ
ncbi:polysaccharide lyase 6 family protein [Flammeovirgaceae bacterium SG7u.111]|nr:polysaccharide lyase 6 family protein [Flammeovirgaceae bacterium SG7u.132]WPO33232.1 polysaccharide lyase 6 family protein [Flammeovirgaceae bacterium SG7u.111]